MEDHEIKQKLDDFLEKSEIKTAFNNGSSFRINNILKILKLNNFITNNSTAFTLTSKGKDANKKTKFHPKFEAIFTKIL